MLNWTPCAATLTCEVPALRAAFLPERFLATPQTRMTELAAMLKAIHAQENKETAWEQATAVVRKLQELAFAKDS